MSEKTKEKKQKKIQKEQEEFEKLAMDYEEAIENLEEAYDSFTPKENVYFPGMAPIEVKYREQVTDFNAMLECHPMLKIVYEYLYFIMLFSIVSILFLWLYFG